VTAFITEAEMAGLVAELVAATPYYFGWGTGSGQAQGDTTLASEAATPRVLSAASQATTNFANDTARFTATLTAETDLAISEVGAFNFASGGFFAIYGDFDGINLAAGDAITFQVNVVYA
jgi:hypothetical protein